MKKKVFVIAFLVFSTTQLIAQNIYNYKHSLEFAEYLEKSKQFDFSIQEYERLLFMRPNSDSLKLNIITNYRKAGYYSKGIERTKQLFPETLLAPQSIAKEYAAILLLNKEYEQAKNYCSKNNTLSPIQKTHFISSAQLLQFDWQGATKSLLTYDSLQKTNPDNNWQQAVAYKKLTEEEPNARYKKPAIAMSLSAIIPGLGKVYTKDYKDALIGFIIVGSSAFNTYRGFSKHGINSAYGWVFGGVALGFYSGNIYGAYNAVKKYNHRLRDKIYNKVETEFIQSL